MSNGIEGLLEVAGAAAVEGIAMTGADREYCGNCGEKFLGPYCANCGQERDTHRRSIFGLAHDFFEDLLSFDNRILRTARALVAQPGELPRAFREGRVRRYVPPIRLYFFVTLLFFVTVYATGIAIVKLQITEQTLTPAQKQSMQLKITEATEKTKEAIAKAQAAQAKSGRADPELAEDAADAAETSKQLTEDLKDSTPGLEAHFFVPSGGPPPNLSAATRKSIGDMQAGLAKKEAQLAAKGDSKKWALWFVSRIDSATRTLARDPDAVNGPLMDWIPRSLFFLLPIFALLMALFYMRQRKDFYFVDHLVFSLNIHTFAFVVLSLIVLLSLWVSGAYLGWLALAMVTIYNFLAMKRFYRQGWALTAVKFLSVSFVYFFFFLLPALCLVIIASVLQT